MVQYYAKPCIRTLLGDLKVQNHVKNIALCCVDLALKLLKGYHHKPLLAFESDNLGAHGLIFVAPKQFCITCLCAISCSVLCA